MALTAAKYTSMWSTSDTDADYLTSDEISEMTASFTNNDYINDKATLAMLGPVMHQIQKMQEELDYLRGLISTNKDKTGITNSQASAITANTAKTGITSQQATDISNNKTSISTNATNIANRLKVDVLPIIQPGVTQEVKCAVVYDSKAKTHSMVFAYSETTPAPKGGKATTVTKTGSIQLK
tara:strand:- start:341 stop:886 length:546 start_codon:yes stop_codon:yes gene_type:complete